MEVTFSPSKRHLASIAVFPTSVRVLSVGLLDSEKRPLIAQLEK